MLASKISELIVDFLFSVDELIQIDADIIPPHKEINDELILNLVTAEESEPEETMASPDVAPLPVGCTPQEKKLRN